MNLTLHIRSKKVFDILTATIARYEPEGMAFDTTTDFIECLYILAMTHSNSYTELSHDHNGDPIISC